MDPRLTEALGLVLEWFEELPLVQQFLALLLFFCALSAFYLLLAALAWCLKLVEQKIFSRATNNPLWESYNRKKRMDAFKLNLLFLTVGLGSMTAYQYVQFGKIIVHKQAENLVLDIMSLDTASPEPALRTRGSEITGWVARVLDGDTLDLRTSGFKQYRVRLHGIDAPETTQYFGREAGRELMRKIIGERVRVVLEDFDQYGRLVGRVYLGEEYINLSLVESGHAWWYSQYARDDRDLEGAQARASDAGLGLWVGSDPIPPWQWRRLY